MIMELSTNTSILCLKVLLQVYLLRLQPVHRLVTTPHLQDQLVHQLLLHGKRHQILMDIKDRGIKKCDGKCGTLLKLKVQVSRDRHIRHRDMHMMAEAEVEVEVVEVEVQVLVRVDIEDIGSMSVRLSVSQWSRWRRRKRELTVR